MLFAVCCAVGKKHVAATPSAWMQFSAAAKRSKQFLQVHTNIFYKCTMRSHTRAIASDFVRFAIKGLYLVPHTNE